MIRVAAFTGGSDVPSARFRVRQYIPYLQEHGLLVEEMDSRFSCYPPPEKWLRPTWGAATLLSRLPSVVRSYGFDVTLLQREMVSTFMTLEPFTKRPRVLDVDDAIWVHRGGRFIERIARSCSGVICGNAFLAEHFSGWNPYVVIIPTAIDTDRHVPVEQLHERSPVIGWSGTSSGFRYLYEIEDALRVVLEECPEAKLRIVSDTQPTFSALPSEQVEFIQWSPSSEVAAIQGMTVGVMPLEDSVWARGKCSYKMLAYMSCAVPVVVSPVGMNKEVLEQGDVGIGPKTRREWVEALMFMLENPGEAREMGDRARKLVLDRYSVKSLVPGLAKTLIGIAETGG